MGNKVKGAVTGHPVLAGMGLLAVVCAVVGGFVWNSMFGLEQSVVYFGVPNAPTLTATGDETLYRLDASRSKVTYAVDEKLAGTTHTANGTTRGIAGDIALNTKQPSASRIGDIVINVQQLTSATTTSNPTTTKPPPSPPPPSTASPPKSSQTPPTSSPSPATSPSKKPPNPPP